MNKNYKCSKDSVNSTYTIQNCENIKETLIHDVYKITKPLFHVFNSFSLTEKKVKEHIKDLFDPDKELNNNSS